MSERRYVVILRPDDVSCTLEEAKTTQGKFKNNTCDILALVPFAELEAMEKDRAEMLAALKKSVEWFKEENILEPQELSATVIERMDAAIARAEGRGE